MTNRVQPTADTLDPHSMSQGQFAQLGVAQVAYIKPVMVQGVRAFAVHGADGTPMGVADGFGLAMAAIIEHEMLPALVH